MKIFVVSNFPSCRGIQSSRFFYLPKETGFENVQNLAYFRPFAPGNFALFIYLFVNSALNSLLKLGSLSQALMSQNCQNYCLEVDHFVAFCSKCKASISEVWTYSKSKI